MRIDTVKYNFTTLDLLWTHSFWNPWITIRPLIWTNQHLIYEDNVNKTIGVYTLFNANKENYKVINKTYLKMTCDTWQCWYESVHVGYIKIVTIIYYLDLGINYPKSFSLGVYQAISEFSALVFHQECSCRPLMVTQAHLTSTFTIDTHLWKVTTGGS